MPSLGIGSPSDDPQRKHDTAFNGYKGVLTDSTQLPLQSGFVQHTQLMTERNGLTHEPPFALRNPHA
jgi:hypothetical protein